MRHNILSQQGAKMSKIQLQDFVKYGRLFETYGSLLSEDRQKIMTAYFEYNMTLVEIAEERKVTRQAVLDAIDKSCEKLDKFENALHMNETKQNLVLNLQELKTLADKNSQKEISEKVDNILRKL